MPDALSNFQPIYVVMAIPPKVGIYADLKPRPQCWNDGIIEAYRTKAQAQTQADACLTDHNKWDYQVEMVELSSDKWRYDELHNQND
jgi:hypothetical protein